MVSVRPPDRIILNMKKRSKKKRTLPKKKNRRVNIAALKPNKIHFDAVENLAGFAAETIEKGETGKILTRGSVVSDDPLFYTYIESITGIFFRNVLVNSVFQFLILIHDDLSADLYLNDLPTKILMMSKRNLKKGEIIRANDIADVGKMSFENIRIKDTDKVLYCFKVGWKFGLFFDLNREEPLNIESMETELGSLYRYLSFQHVYNTLESASHFDQLLSNGWFPFIEIIGSEFKEVSKAYELLREPHTKIQELIDKFDKQRIDKICKKWWGKPPFSDKKIILESGIDSYLRGDNQGFIGCIKTLLPEIEGIIRLHYFEETGKGKNVKIPELISHIVEKGKIKTGSEFSLFFPRAFFEYLKESVFPNFDLEQGDISLSRHTSSHGIAKAEDYTKVRALQMILILDQIYFYI